MSEWNRTRIRDLEIQSLHTFILDAARDFLKGRVLDYGCGKQPYRCVVEHVGGVYFPYDRKEFSGNVSGEDVGVPGKTKQFDPLNIQQWDAILCTQIFNFVPYPATLFQKFHWALKPSGILVLTYTTSWEEAEAGDLWRFTRQGINFLLNNAGFEILIHTVRAAVELEDFRFPLGGGVVARRGS